MALLARLRRVRARRRRSLRTARRVGVGPVYENTQSLGLGDISVYSDSFSLGLTPVDTWSFQLTSVPEPTSLLMVATGLLGLFAFGTRRRSGG